MRGLKSLGRERSLVQFLGILREALARGTLDAMLHVASLAQLGDNLTKRSDSKVVARLLEQNGFRLWTTEKREGRIARSAALRVWQEKGPPSYHWGRVLEAFWVDVDQAWLDHYTKVIDELYVTAMGDFADAD